MRFSVQPTRLLGDPKENVSIAILVIRYDIIQIIYLKKNLACISKREYPLLINNQGFKNGSNTKLISDKYNLLN